MNNNNNNNNNNINNNINNNNNNNNNKATKRNKPNHLCTANITTTNGNYGNSFTDSTEQTKTLQMTPRDSNKTPNNTIQTMHNPIENQNEGRGGVGVRIGGRGSPGDVALTPESD